MTRSELEAEYEKIRRVTTAALDGAEVLEQAARDARRDYGRAVAFRLARLYCYLDSRAARSPGKDGSEP